MKKAGILMVLGAMTLLGLFYYPLWTIRLVAPQYPEGLGMYIHIDDIKGHREFDLRNIDGLNHYIGMKTIPKAEEMWEFSAFPIILLVMVGLGVLIGILGYLRKIKPSMFMVWFVVMAILGILGLYDFNLWLNDYGTNLDPSASIKLLDANGSPMVYKPPLLGHVKLLNFDVDSWPHVGGYLMGLSFGLVLLAYLIGAQQLDNVLKFLRLKK